MKVEIIVALDGMARNNALSLAEAIGRRVWGFKVNDLLLDCGIEIIEDLKDMGRVFADTKLYDIPNTVANGVKKLDAAGADFITVHASGGSSMLRAAKQAATKAKILAVSALTSMTDDDTKAVYDKDFQTTLATLTRLAVDAQVDGLVLPVTEVLKFKEYPGIKVCPGFRLPGTDHGDQKQVGDRPDGADFVVIGRNITTARDPVEVVEKIKDHLKAL